jgi:hypothetical protein
MLIGLPKIEKEEGRREKGEGIRNKEEGRRKKEEGRRKKEEGRRRTCNVVAVEVIVLMRDNGSLAELGHTRSHSLGNVFEYRLVPTINKLLESRRADRMGVDRERDLER